MFGWLFFFYRGTSGFQKQETSDYKNTHITGDKKQLNSVITKITIENTDIRRNLLVYIFYHELLGKC